jgi:hypothetical protein
MGHVPYVGWATRSRATAMTRFTFLKKKKKKKKPGHHMSQALVLIGLIETPTFLGIKD